MYVTFRGLFFFWHVALVKLDLVVYQQEVENQLNADVDVEFNFGGSFCEISASGLIYNAQHKFDQQNSNHKNEKKVDLLREHLQIRILLHQKNEGQIHQAIASKHSQTKDSQNNSCRDLQVVKFLILVWCENKNDVKDYCTGVDSKAGKQHLVKTPCFGLLKGFDWVFENLISPVPLKQQCERDNGKQVSAYVVEGSVKSNFFFEVRVRGWGAVFIGVNDISDKLALTCKNEQN